MIEAGRPVPDVTVWVEPGGRRARLPELGAGGPFLLLFYVWDWTPT
jgi:peroxiredoxin